MLFEFCRNYAVLKTHLAAFHYLMLDPCAQVLTFSFKATQIFFTGYLSEKKIIALLNERLISLERNKGTIDKLHLALIGQCSYHYCY